MKKIIFVFCILFSVLMVGSALADTIFLTNPNTALSGFPGPYAEVDINLTDSTHASIAFTGLTGINPSPPPTTLYYLLGDGSSVALNVNASTFTVGSITSTFLTGFTPGPFSVTNPPGTQNVSDFGSFNLTIKDFDGNSHSAQSISFILTNTSGTWLSGSDVLTLNGEGFMAAAHIFVSTGNATDNNLTTGFAGNGTPVPEPTTMLLLGSGLVGLVGLRKKFRK